MAHDTFDQIPEIALDWHKGGQGAVLATVMQTWGSAPRPVGAQLVVSGDGAIMGSVSGGCVEGAVVAEAADVLASGVPRRLTFGVSDDAAFAVGLACGGTIEVLVDPVGVGQGLPVDMLQTLCDARAGRQPVALSVDLSDWTHALHGPDDASLTPQFRADRSAVLEDGAGFVTVFNPPLRLIVVGAVHIAQPLVSMARMAGYDPFVIDPRASFGSDSRFPGQAISNDWPDEAMAAHGLDRRTAVVTLTHDAKLDDPAIVAALRSDVFYLGCLGSTRTHAKRLERLAAAGMTHDDIARIHAPVGLNIGAKSPAEIAISIMAQLTQTLRGL